METVSPEKCFPWYNLVPFGTASLRKPVPKELPVAHPFTYPARLALSAVTLALATPILALPVIVTSIFTRSDRMGFSMMRIWASIVSRAMGLTFSLEGEENVVPSHSYIVTPNHQGNADILALIRTLPVPFLWVIKREILQIPFLGWALGRMGTVSLDRADKEQAVKSLNQASGKLSDGWSVIIYPEGTRTRDGTLMPFKKGAFRLAIKTGVPILPVTTNGAFKVMPRKATLFRPGHVTVTIGEPIPTEGLTDRDLSSLMEKTYKAVRKNLNVDYDPFALPSSRLLQAEDPARR